MCFWTVGTFCSTQCCHRNHCNEDRRYDNHRVTLPHGKGELYGPFELVALLGDVMWDCKTRREHLVLMPTSQLLRSLQKGVRDKRPAGRKRRTGSLPMSGSQSRSPASANDSPVQSTPRLCIATQSPRPLLLHFCLLYVLALNERT